MEVEDDSDFYLGKNKCHKILLDDQEKTSHLTCLEYFQYEYKERRAAEDEIATSQNSARRHPQWFLNATKHSEMRIRI